MPDFEYKGRNHQGQAVNGKIEAISADAVAVQLSNSGIIPIEIIPAKKNADKVNHLNFNFSKNKKPELDDLVLFSRQMYTLMHAGVPIIRAITGLSETTRNLILQNAL
ncbi:MAG: type II secretion system F family protein, partial [Gammaproteobacteria bacterium]|nr:type II secretion system F family protein [Gammaproteobacteria bacterium]